MGVSDVTTLTQTAVLVYNSNASVTQSLETCDRYRAMRGIPAANAFGYDFGSGVTWTPASEAACFAFIDALADHCTSVGATGCYAVAGCPVAINLRLTDDSGTGAFDFTHIIASAKLLQATGEAPRVVADGAGGYFLQKRFLAWPAGQNVWVSALGSRVSEHPTILEAYNDSRYDAACALGSYGSGAANQFLRYQSSFSQSSFADSTRLLGGWVGYYTHEDASHPTFDQSRIILGRANNSEGRLSSLSARKVLCGIVYTEADDTSIGKTARCAMMARACEDAGLDVTYWYDDSDTAANYLMPESGTHSNWTDDTLTAGTATGTQSPDVLLGWSFANGMASTWAANITPTVNSIFIGGRSGNGQWGKWIQGFGHSAIIQQIEEGGTHSTVATSISRQTDALLLLLDGKTLAEAAWVSNGGTLMAYGDPLCRPFQ